MNGAAAVEVGEAGIGIAGVAEEAYQAPAYWPTAVAALSLHADVAQLINRYPGMKLRSRGDAFTTLARSIVGQQISVKAADSVWAKLIARLNELNTPQLNDRQLTAKDSITPAMIVSESAEQATQQLQGCGLSKRKIEYLIALSQHFSAGQIKPELWPQQSDSEIINTLTAVRGIGQWTAEMFLIFTLMRPDIFPVADIGLQRAVAQYFFEGAPQTTTQLTAWSKQYQPWRTVLTWYLWRSLDPIPVEY